MEVLFYCLTFIGFVLVSGVSTGSFSSSFASSRASSNSEAYSSSYSSSSASSSSYSSQDNSFEPSKPKCKKNEKEVSCINSVCEYRNCSDIGKPIKCVRLNPTKCIRGCICESEYLRNDSTGICIPKDYCPSYKCGVNEIYDTCLPICPPPRCDVDEKTIQCQRNPDPGDPACKSGCRCIDNYKQNESGVCIPKEECPVTPTEICGPDEEYLDCANGGCGRWECSQQGQACVDVAEGGCVGGCRCKAPLLRAEDGSCVPADQCPALRDFVLYYFAFFCTATCNGQNEIVGCQTACPETCESIGKNCTIIETKVCKRGCRCKPGFYRNKNGECISEEECRTECGVNEIYDICPATCPPARCDVDEKTILCLPNPQPGDSACKPGCRCIDNYKKNATGVCIPKEECPVTPPETCGPDEEYLDCANGGCGRWECSQQGQACVDVVEGGCVGGCRCKAPLLRADDGSCVPADQCPVVATECGVNEVYDICPATCPPARCDVDEKTILCAPNPKPGDSACEPGCRCIDNYKKNATGVCIPKEECPVTPPEICGPDEEYLDCANGGCGRWECSQRGQACVDVAEGGCVGGCRCKAPLLRADDGSCVPADQCPATECGVNEIYDICPPTCPPQICDVDERLIRCAKNPEPGDSACKPGCRCIDNYKKNATGTCIPKEECPVTSPETCGPDEEYLDCANGGCGRWECSQRGQACVDVVEGGCVGGCRCKAPLLRADDGSCVPADQCPATECGVNEIYDICPPTCPPQRCDVDERIIRCAKNPEPGDRACKPGCRCIDNYKKNATGTCIPKEECPGVVNCGPNEIISSCVNGGCGRWNCSQPGEICIKLPENGCRQGCHCIDTYLRADNGTCIPADQCPSATTPSGICREDEVYLECANGGCGRWECAQQGQLCVDVVEGGCIPGCRCKDPLLRTEDGSCVPADQCPLICTGQNEAVGCRTLCPETCNSIGKNCSIIEPAVCVPACRCKPGFYRNENNVCVPEEQCPIIPPGICRDDEVYLECANGGCGRWECAQQGQLCVDVVEGGCVGGCRCKEPLLRAADGSCVPAEQCPPIIPPGICRDDEVYLECANGGCGRWECAQQGQLCVDLVEGGCIGGCRCKEPLLRAADGSCVAADQCPPTNPPGICRDDEVYLECANGGCGRWDCAQQGQLCVDVVEGGCIPGCRCKDPLLRTEDGSCVPADQCPLICTGQNEAVGCRTLCPETCNSIGKNCSIIEPAVCVPACRCKPGFYRNSNNVCVPEEQCPTPIVCRPDEVYSGCSNGGCGRWKCSQPGPLCIDLVEGGCIEGCRCKEPLLRAEDGSCVPAEQCPPICTGQNEIVGCQTACPETCSSIDKNCTIIEAAVCKPACRCKPGFYRNKIGDCISKEQCLQCSGPNEFFSCGSACDNVCSKLSTENQTNCPILNIVCNPKCYCEDTYARDDYNICIPIDECPSNENGIKKFNDGNIAFTEKFLRVASKINSGISAVYSPFSLLFLLAPLGLYTKGNSEQQIFRALNLQSRSLVRTFIFSSSKKCIFNIRSTIPVYLDEFNSQKNVSLDLAARVYVNIQYKLTKAFEQDTKNLFKAEAQNLDFSKSVQAAKTINDWVELITKNLIKNLVSPDTLSVDTRLVLVNAIYFKGDWLYPFKTENTQKQDFYVNKNKNVTVNMMNQIGSFKYAEIKKSNIQVIELPYANRNLSFVVCLPKSKDGIEELISTLGDPSSSVLTTVIKSLKYKRVDVSIPTMEVTTTTDLKNVLSQLQVTGIFEPEKANLDGILEKSENMFVSSATQKATIIVTETGTKAAAANALVVGVTSVLEPVEVTTFLADHPFAYFILYNGTPIFCGIYRGPQ
ncbi:zonadhesin-like [Vanessa cardui]|uniref:zonadhesin-like n=1 Tax=Vanessa cardui TaxID=171605 RepID=UPI001F129598|nr:zonadhesin-like [Vanessa cardui]